MKKLVLSLIVFISTFISYSQGGSRPTGVAVGINQPVDYANFRRLCSNTLDISTPTGWVPVGSIATSASTFYGHTNWIDAAIPQNKSHQFKRTFYIGRAGTYTFNVKGMGDNKMVLTVGGTTLIDYDVTVASGFNTPAKGNASIELQCGVYELVATISNYTLSAGFYVDGSITSKEGCVGDEKIACEVQKEVCRCPQGWLSNTSNEDGGITTDGLCKKMICGPINTKPYPANGTQVSGNIGFFWDGNLYWYGTKENGGSVKCKKEWVVIDPKAAAKEDVNGRGGK